MRKAVFQIGVNLLVIFAAEFAVRESIRLITGARGRRPR